MRFRNTVALAFLMLASQAALVAAEGARRELVAAGNVHFQEANGTITRGVRCATHEPGAAGKARVEAALAYFRELHGGAKAAITWRIPIRWHVIQASSGEGAIDAATLAEQVRVLNRAFASAGFAFELAGVDTTVNDAWFRNCYGAERRIKRELAIDPAHNLNIYSCKPGQGILGWAYYPDSAPEDSTLHGVVVHYGTVPDGYAAPYNGGDTATHEVGHYLGLFHTFQGGCSEPGDAIADTPFEASPAFGCPVGRDTCSQAGLDPIENFMDYTDDACMDTFTPDQEVRMQQMTTLYRPSL